MQNKILYRHILTGVLILLLPVVVLTGFIQTKILNRIRESYVYQLENQVMYNVNDMEQVFFSLDSVTTDIAYSDAFAFQSDLKDVTAVRNVLKELHGYTINNVFIKELMLWQEGDDYVYLSSGSTCREDKLYKLYPQFAQMGIQDVVKEQPGTLRYFFVDPSEEEESEQICSVSLYKGGQRIVLIFLLELGEVKNVQNFFVFDKTGNILFHTKMDDGLLEKANVYTPVDKYLNIMVEKNSRNYVRYYSEDQVYANFWNMQMAYCCIVGAVLLCGIFLIYLGAKNNLLPVLRHRQESTDSAQFSFLYKVLKGKYTREEFQSLVEQNHLLKLQGDLFFIIVFLLPEYEPGDKNEEIERIFQQYLNGYLLELPEGKKYVYIGSLEQAKAKEYSQLAHFVWKEMEQELGVEVSFSVGALFEQMEEIQQVFLRTSLALELKFARGNSCCIDSEQIFDDELVEGFWPRRLIDQVLLNIRLANINEVDKTLDEINRHIKTSRMPLIYSKGICYDLIMQLADLAYSIGIFEESERPSYSMILHQSDTVDELTDKIHNIANNICLGILEKKSQGQDGKIVDFDRFIEEHALLEKFSVQYMADYFEMSTSKLCNVYKKQTGNTIIERVTQIRMEAAEKLLMDQEHNYTVNEIVEKIGYNNTSSFIRKFKSIYGVTPGQYVKAKKEV